MGSTLRAVDAARTGSVSSFAGCVVFYPPYFPYCLSQNVTFGHMFFGIMLRMDQNTIRHFLFIKVTEIVEVTETITILIEDDVLNVEQDLENTSPTVNVTAPLINEEQPPQGEYQNENLQFD